MEEDKPVDKDQGESGPLSVLQKSVKDNAQVLMHSSPECSLREASWGSRIRAQENDTK